MLQCAANHGAKERTPVKLPDTMKKMGGGKLAFALLALFPFASGAATYYASPDGTGSGTYESPYSLSEGINKVKTYAHTLILKPGRSSFLRSSMVILAAASRMERSRVV